LNFPGIERKIWWASKSRMGQIPEIRRALPSRLMTLIGTREELIENIAREKLARRKNLAQLTFEKKIERLVELQKRASVLNPKIKVWKIPANTKVT